MGTVIAWAVAFWLGVLSLAFAQVGKEDESRACRGISGCLSILWLVVLAVLCTLALR